MHKVFTRALERRGVYVGVTTGWLLEVPRPRFFFVINEPSNDMVRIELGFGHRNFWVDWGRRPS